jgi:hypothetical protein
MTQAKNAATEPAATALKRASDLRHSLRNRLASIRYATFYMQRRIEGTSLWNDDPKMQRFFDVLTKEIVAADDLITRIAVDYLNEGTEPK